MGETPTSDELEAAHYFAKFTKREVIDADYQLADFAPPNSRARRIWLSHLCCHFQDESTATNYPLSPVDLLRQIEALDISERIKSELRALLDTLHDLPTVDGSSPRRALPSIPGIRLIRPLGKGGGGTVFECEKPNSGLRRLAVKVVAWRQSQPNEDKPVFLRRFEREYELLKGMTHPHIIPVFDFGVANDHYFYTMPLMLGGTLQERACVLSERSWVDSKPAFFQIILPLCQALIYAHEKGIVHRDLKPTNILFDLTEEPKIADFGIAKLIQEKTIDESVAALGTTRFSAPEVLYARSEADARSDIFSLGAIIQEVLIGRRDQNPQQFDERKSKLPIALIHLIDKCTKDSPVERYHSVAEVYDILHKIQVADQNVSVESPHQIAREPRRFFSLTYWVAAPLTAALIAYLVWQQFSRWSDAVHDSNSTSADPVVQESRDMASLLGGLEHLIADLDKPYIDSDWDAVADGVDKLSKIIDQKTDHKSVDFLLSFAKYVRLKAELEVKTEKFSPSIVAELDAAVDLLNRLDPKLVGFSPEKNEFEKKQLLFWKALVDASTNQKQRGIELLERLGDYSTADVWADQPETMSFRLEVMHRLADLDIDRGQYDQAILTLDTALARIAAATSFGCKVDDSTELAILSKRILVLYRLERSNECYECIELLEQGCRKLVTESVTHPSSSDHEPLVDFYQSTAENFRGALDLQRAEDPENFAIAAELREQAEHRFIDAIARRRRLLTKFGPKRKLLVDLNSSVANLGTIYQKYQMTAEAIRIAQNQADLYGDLAAKNPLDGDLLIETIDAKYRLAKAIILSLRFAEAKTILSESISQLEIAKKLFPDFADALNARQANHFAQRAECSMQTGEFELAIPDWLEASQRCLPKLKDGYEIGLAHCYAQTEDYSSCENLLNQLADRKLSGDLLFNLAEVYVICGLNNDSLSNEERALILAKVEKLAGGLANPSDRQELLGLESVARLRSLVNE